MAWARLDDGMFDNPKIAALSDAAQLAHVKAIVYCARNLTDGAVHLRKAKEWASPKVIKELVPRLWEPTSEGFLIHDYLQYNPSRDQVLREREAAKQRMRGVRSPDVRPNKQENFERGSHAPDPVPLPDPVDTDPQPTPTPKPRLPSRVVVVGFEQAFGRLLSPTELELIKALEDEHPKERIEFALREAAALNKRSVRYVQRTCEGIANGGSDGTDQRLAAAAAHPNGVANRVPDMDRRSLAIADRARRFGA